MPQLHQTQDSNVGIAGSSAKHQDFTAPVRVLRKPYVNKKLPKRAQGQRVYVSFSTFKKEIGSFDPEMRQLYTNKEIVAVLCLTMKKAVDRIIKKMWRMPFPNGMGLLYMKEAQRSCSELQSKGILNDKRMEQLMREVRLGLKRVLLKWNKERVRFSYKDIWTVKKSNGYFRSVLYSEIIERAEDPTKPNYRGHII